MIKRMKVLIAYDGSDNAQVVLTELQRMGLPREVDAIVISVASVELPPVPDYEIATTSFNDRLNALLKARAQVFYEVIMKERNKALLAVRDALQLARQASKWIKSEFPDWNVRAEAYADSPASAVVKKADDWGADLILVGAQGHSTFGQFLLGSVSQRIVNEPSCSVRVARKKFYNATSPVRILIGLDGMLFAEKVSQAITERVWPVDSEVRLVTVTKSPGLYGVAPDEQPIGTTELQQTVATRLQQAGLNVSSVITEGEAKNVLLAEAESWDADCIFVGSSGPHSAWKRFFLGSVSTAVVTNATCSVEVVC